MTAERRRKIKQLRDARVRELTQDPPPYWKGTGAGNRIRPPLMPLTVPLLRAAPRPTADGGKG